jgi:3-oxoadipate enol-lactonase
MWDRVVAHFEASFHVLRFDNRGHGLSSVPDRPYSVDRLGSDLLRLLDHLGVGPSIVCGLSLGGLIGQWLGIHAPERVRALILANSAARFLSRDAWEARIGFVEAQGMNVLAKGTLSRWFTAGYIEHSPEEMKQIASMIEKTPQQGYIGGCEVLRDADLRGLLSRIKAPCLVIGGSHDPATPPADGHVLQAGIRGSRYVELDASHLSAWERPAEFAAAVLEFLGEEGSI